jgi:hypothetical protein
VVSGTGSASGGRGSSAGSPVLLSPVLPLVGGAVVVGRRSAVLLPSSPLLLLAGAVVLAWVLPALRLGVGGAGGEHEGREGEQRDRDDTGDHRRPIYHAGRMPGTPASM